MNTLFEYITAILTIALALTLIAYFRERSENIRLKQDLAYAGKMVEKLRRKIELLTEHRVVENTALPENLDLKILELYSSGFSYGQIAKQLGISKSTVYRRLKRMLEEKPKTPKLVIEKLRT